MNQLCKVCSEPAAGFHFGAFTCEGCKSFFGRTYNNLSQIHECKTGGQCVINKQNRTSCKACRLRKCLIVGMSKSGSRYGRRSNWFKIHCVLEEQAANLSKGLEADGTFKFQFSVPPPTAKRLSPSTCTDEEGKLGSPALSSPDSNTSDTSVDVEPRRSLSCSSLQSSNSQHLPIQEHESIVAHELNRRASSALATVGGRSLGPPGPGTDFVAGLSLYGIHSGMSLLQASSLYQRLYPSFLFPGINNYMDQLSKSYEFPSSDYKRIILRTPSPNPSCSINSLPPSPAKTEQLSSPPSPQSLPLPDLSELVSHKEPASPHVSPLSRKRPAESFPEQDSPIDLSAKRPKLSVSKPLSLPDLTPIVFPFHLSKIPGTANSTIAAGPVDLTLNA